MLIWIAALIEFIRLSPINLAFLVFLQLVNGIVLYLQDKNSRNAVETLKKSLAPHAVVKRDGQWKRVKVNELVFGDRILIASGDLLPADCILGPGECLIDQSMLTGETRELLKIEGNKVYMGSICKKGEIEANVSATGTNTFFGKSNLFSSEVSQKGNMEKVLNKVAFLLMIIGGILVTVMLVILLYKGNEFLESLSTCAVMLVLTLPIAMQTVCASTLAVGANRLNKRKAVVSKLASIEELASMELICIHKTGMFTKGEPNINSHVLFSSPTLSHLFTAAYLSSKRDIKNPIDKCICEYAVKNLKLNFDDFEEEDFFQYNPKNKRSTVNVRNVITGEIFKYCKGAPQVILALTEQWRLENEVADHVQKFAESGYSTIAVAGTNNSGQWEFLGLISLFDPFFEGVNEQIQYLRNFGIKILLLTGDQISITKSISKTLNLGDLIFNAEVFNKDTSTVEREFLDTILLQADGFAEVFPEHKLTIVKMIQKKGLKVGMTGTSINDAGALKRSEVGMAAFEATDAAKSSSDIIFNEPGMQIIYQAVVKARKIFGRAKTYCIYRISCSCQLLLFFFIILVGIDPKNDFKCRDNDCSSVPNTAAFPVIALIIIVLLNDFTIISISSDRVNPSKTPCKWDLVRVFITSAVLGAVSFFSSFAYLLVSLMHMDARNPNLIFEYFGIPTYSYGQILTAMFMKISISNYLTLYSARCISWFFLSRPGIELLILSVLSLTSTTLLSKYWFLNVQPKNSVVVATMHPIDWNSILVIWVFCICMFILQDILKMSLYSSYNKIENNGSDSRLKKMCLAESIKNIMKNTNTGILTERSILAAMT